MYEGMLLIRDERWRPQWMVMHHSSLLQMPSRPGGIVLIRSTDLKLANAPISSSTAIPHMRIRKVTTDWQAMPVQILVEEDY